MKEGIKRKLDAVGKHARSQNIPAVIIMKNGVGKQYGIIQGTANEVADLLTNICASDPNFWKVMKHVSEKFTEAPEPQASPLRKVE